MTQDPQQDPHQEYRFGSPPVRGATDTWPHEIKPPVRRAGLMGNLRPGQKTGLFIGLVAAVIVSCCGGLTIIGALTGGSQPTRQVADGQSTSPTSGSTESVAQASAPGDLIPTVSVQPKIEKRTVVETQAIAYATRTVKDSSLAEGTTKVQTQGVPGVKTLTFEVTFTDGVQTAKNLIRQEITKNPVTKVVRVGTKQSNCDPNYIWACVPIASDVDCAGGSGNGPAYVSGPVKVVGTDIYDLDRDGDGIACE